ncbi:MAG: hypothetical protein ACRDOK_07415 [Streptosporangiaceae bacterium]
MAALGLAGGLTGSAGLRLGVHQATVGKWRARFIERRLDGLCDEDRPGWLASITDEQVGAGQLAFLKVGEMLAASIKTYLRMPPPGLLRRA